MKVLDISITVKKLWKPHFYEFLMKINPYRSFANGVKVLFSGLDGLYLKSSVHTQFFLIRHGSRVINLECSVSVPNNQFFFGNTQENENYIT